MYLSKCKLITSLLLLTLVACSSDPSDPTSSGISDSSDSSDSTSSGITISGTAADGYLQGAKVCLDVNQNGVCDTTEPTATTTAGGVYNIEVSASTPTDRALIVEVPVGAIDEDNPTKPIDTPYTMKAPAGKHSFVSPTTTLVQQAIENNPALSAEEAETVVKTSMDIGDENVSLFTDYVKAQASTDHSQDDKAQYNKIHKVARVVALAIGEQHKEVVKAAQDSGIEPKDIANELFALVMEAIEEKLGDIVAAVEGDEAAKAAKDFEATKAYKDAGIQHNTSKDKIVEDVKKKKQQLDKAVATLDELIQANLMSIKVDKEAVFINKIAFSKDDMQFKSYKHDESQSPPWTVSDDNGISHRAYNVSDKEWIDMTANDEAYTLAVNGDGRFVAEEKRTGERYKFFIIKNDISETKLADYEEDVSPSETSGTAPSGTEPSGTEPSGTEPSPTETSGTKTFPSGSVAYIADVIRGNDQFRIDFWKGHSNPEMCRETGTKKVLPKDVGENCNVIYKNDGTPIATLDAMLGGGWSGYAHAEDQVYGFQLEKNKDGNGTTGKITYKKFGNKGEDDVVLKDAGTWEKKTASGLIFMALHHPKRLEGKAISRNKEHYIVHNGFVRTLNYAPKNYPTDGGQAAFLNSTAAKAVLATHGINSLPSD